MASPPPKPSHARRQATINDPALTAREIALVDLVGNRPGAWLVVEEAYVADDLTATRNWLHRRGLEVAVRTITDSYAQCWARWPHDPVGLPEPMLQQLELDFEGGAV